MAQPVRSVEIDRNQNTFLVVAVCTVLTIRLQLWATDYPQLGGGNLHIAHLLYGGLFMVITVLMLSSFVGRRWRLRGAVLGGVGFGFFIDEVGKFITKDNDYFFQPVAAIIYIVFLLLFFATRLLQRNKTHSPEEAVANAIDIYADAARPNGLSVSERAEALALLDLAPDHPATPGLRQLISTTPAVPVAPPSWVRRRVLRAREAYAGIVEEVWFRRALVGLLSLWAFANILSVLDLVLALGVKIGGAHAGFVSDDFTKLRFVNIASIVSAAVATGLMITGLMKLRHDRLEAYHYIERALLITVFVTQLFIFAESSFSAATGMVIAVVLLLTVRYMIRQERRMAGPAPEPPGEASTPAPGAGTGTAAGGPSPVVA